MNISIPDFIGLVLAVFSAGVAVGKFVSKIESKNHPVRDKD